MFCGVTAFAIWTARRKVTRRAGASAGRVTVIPPPSRWSGTTKQTMSYGYGLSATPLQIAHAYATLGNDGVSIKPTFIKGEQGERRQVISPPLKRWLITSRLMS